MTAFTEGIHADLPFADYLALDALSSSRAKKILRSPAHALVQEPDNDAFRIGRLTHMAILEPHRFQRETIVMPKVDRRTKAGKAQAEEFAAAYADRQIIEQDDHDAAMRMADAVHAHPAARAVLAIGRAEMSMLWTNVEHGIRCKARADWWRPTDRIMADLKTTVDASPAAFARAIGKYQYHLQAAHYSNAIEHLEGEMPSAFCFIAVEKTEPFAVGVYMLDADSIARGHALIDSASATYKQCTDTNRWPAYADTIQTISAPAWA